MTATRDRMIDGAIVLLATRGVSGASLGQVIEYTGAPRGSIYHHFPGGRDELFALAVDTAGSRHDAWVAEAAGGSVLDVVDRLLAFWQGVLERSELRSGCPILAITVAAPDGALHDAAKAAFARSLGSLASLFRDAGMPPADARDLALELLAATEGAVVLARAQSDLRPFTTVAAALRERAAGAAALSG